MIIRLGYAVNSKTLEQENLFHTLTYTNYLKESDNQKLENIIINNLSGLEKILQFNVNNNIHFYRMNSSLIPLATHSEVSFDYQKLIMKYLENIGKFINENNLRVDTHPDQYCVLNSTKLNVVKNSIKILKYEAFILKNMNLKHPRIILHIGSSENSKEESIERFVKNFNKLDEEIKKMIVLENDDKIYDIKDTLKLCEYLKIPMVLDYHHHICHNPNNLNIEDYIEKIFKTWQQERPKIHFSSPKSKLKKDFRSHHDYINVYSFIEFINKISFCNQDFDIMLEAKMKDEALFRLIRQLKYLTNYKFIDDTSFII